MTQTMVRHHKQSHREPVPGTMRAAAIDHYGVPEVLTLHELDGISVGPLLFAKFSNDSERNS